MPSAFGHIMNLASTVLTEFDIDTSLKELAILRVAQLSGAKYEWIQHVPLARKSGLSDDKIAAINRGETNSGLFSDREHLVLQFVDELVHGVKVSDTTFNKIKSAMPPQHIVELIIATGNYMMQSRLMETLDLPIDTAVDTEWVWLLLKHS